jgi:hypothetical protein
MRNIFTIGFTFVSSTRFTSALAHGVRRSYDKALRAYSHALCSAHLFFHFSDTLVLSCKDSRRTVCKRTRCSRTTKTQIQHNHKRTHLPTC